MGVIAWIVLGPGAGLLDSRRDPGRDQPQPALQPGGRRTGRGAVPACRVSPLPASSGRLR
jgi:hypothetical protein